MNKKEKIKKAKQDLTKKQKQLISINKKLKKAKKQADNKAKNLQSKQNAYEQAKQKTKKVISANVISATTQKLSDEIYGSMLLGIPNSQFDKATAFLKNFENIKVEEVSADD